MAAVLNGVPGYLMVYPWPRRLLIGPQAGEGGLALEEELKVSPRRTA